MQLKQASDHTLLVQRCYSTCIESNYNSKDAVPIFHDSLSYYQHTDSCLYSTVCSRSISMWNSRFLVRIFFPCSSQKLLTVKKVTPSQNFRTLLRMPRMVERYMPGCPMNLQNCKAMFICGKRTRSFIESIVFQVLPEGLGPAAALSSPIINNNVVSLLEY